MSLQKDWFSDEKHLAAAAKMLQEEASKAYRLALEDVRRDAAEHAMHYRSQADRFGASKQYATAETMNRCAEAYGMVCVDIGWRLGIDAKAALSVCGAAPGGESA